METERAEHDADEGIEQRRDEGVQHAPEHGHRLQVLADAFDAMRERMEAVHEDAAADEDSWRRVPTMDRLS
jgi:hypothetical protein